MFNYSTKIIRITLRYLLTFSILIIRLSLIAQNPEVHEHHHTHPKNEFGIAYSPYYFVKEKEFTHGIHLHFDRTIRDSKFALGIGYERLFDEHIHNFIGIAGSYRLVDEFIISLSPGIAFEGDLKSELKFGLHFETSYEFEIHSLHIGPIVQFAYDPEDYHVSLGLHIGYGF